MSDSKTPTTDDRQKEIEAWSKALARAEDLAIERKKEIQRLQTAINEAYRIMCSGKPPHSAREVNARRVLRLAGVTVKEQSA